MSKIQCPKCKKWLQLGLAGTVYNRKIPQHVCIEDDPIIPNGHEATSIVFDDFNPSSYDSSNDNSSSFDTSSSDIGGGGDFGGAGASSDW